MNKIWKKEILSIKWDNKMKLYLTINFYQEIDCYTIEAKKINFKMDSTNLNLEQAKLEFVEIINLYFEYLIKEGEIFNLFEYYGIKLRSEKEIIEEKTEELKKFDLLNTKNNDKYYLNPYELWTQDFNKHSNNIHLNTNWN